MECQNISGNFMLMHVAPQNQDQISIKLRTKYAIYQKFANFT